MVGGSLASSTTKTGLHDITEILLKVALNTKNQIKSLRIRQRLKFFLFVFNSHPLHNK